MKVSNELVLGTERRRSEPICGVITSPDRPLIGGPAAALRFLIYGRFRGARVLCRSGWVGDTLELLAGTRRFSLVVPHLSLESSALGELRPLLSAPLGARLRPALVEGTGPWEYAEARLRHGDVVQLEGNVLTFGRGAWPVPEPTLELPPHALLGRGAYSRR